MNISAFNQLSYGVVVIASGNESKKNAYIATVAVQVSSSVPQILIACNKANYTSEFIQQSNAFSVSVLRQNYMPTTIGTFGFRSGRDFNKFEHVDCIYGSETGVPIVLTDTIAWFECKLKQSIDVGTHILYVGEVVQCEEIDSEAQPLTYRHYHEVKKGTTPKNAPSFNK